MNIELKIIRKEDLELLMNWRMKSEVTKYMYTSPILNMEKQLVWYNKIKNDLNGIYWIVMCDNQRIGEISIQNIDYINKRCSWAYSIGDDLARGKGIARLLECNIYDYAFYKLNLNKVCCEVFTFNKKVIAIHEKFGAEIEGILKQHIYKDNEYHDVTVMGIIKTKWEKIKNNYRYCRIHIES